MIWLGKVHIIGQFLVFPSGLFEVGGLGFGLVWNYNPYIFVRAYRYLRAAIIFFLPSVHKYFGLIINQ